MNQEVQDAPDLFIVPVPDNEALSDTRKPAHTRLSFSVQRGMGHEWYQSKQRCILMVYVKNYGISVHILESC